MSSSRMSSSDSSSSSPPLPLPPSLPLSLRSFPVPPLQVQIVAQVQNYASPEEFAKMQDLLRRGDIVGVTGSPSRSQAGELSVSPSSMQLLTPNLHALPSAQYPLKDQEVRYRKRYLDLMMNQNVRDIFITRAKVVNYIRKYLDALGFLEVSTLSRSLDSHARGSVD